MVMLVLPKAEPQLRLEMQNATPKPKTLNPKPYVYNFSSALALLRKLWSQRIDLSEHQGLQALSRRNVNPFPHMLKSSPLPLLYIRGGGLR